MEQAFAKTFLSEMPWLLNGNNDFETQLLMLQNNLTIATPVKITDSFFKLQLGKQLTYWMGDESANQVAIIVDTEINGDFCKVVLTSKNPDLQNSKPYTSEMYEQIMHDLKHIHLTFSSDTIISNDAKKLWHNIVKHGGKVSVYDKDTHQYILKSVETPTELDDYIGNIDKKHYVFVLSENMLSQRGIQHSIDILELKRKTHGIVFENMMKHYND